MNTVMDINDIAWEQLEKEAPLSLVEMRDGTFAVIPKPRFGEKPSESREGRIKLSSDGGTSGSFLNVSQFSDPSFQSSYF